MSTLSAHQLRFLQASDIAPLTEFLTVSTPWTTLGLDKTHWQHYLPTLLSEQENSLSPQNQRKKSPAAKTSASATKGTVASASRTGYVLLGANPSVVLGLGVIRYPFLLGGYLELFVINPGNRGSGVGRELLTRLEALVFAQMRNFYLCVSDFNVDARAFYQKLNYHEVGRIPALLVPGSDEIMMRKTLGPVFVR